jgi:uncharacterized protein involved in exopolysaccharide biosynthesis
MSLSLADVAEIVGKQFWRMVLIGGLCAGAAGWALLSTPPTYEARTLLLYKLGREYLYVPDAGEVTQGIRAPDPGDLMQIIGAEMQIVVNRELRRRFLEEYGVDRVFPGVFPDAATNPASLDAAIEWLRGIVTVGLVPNTLMVEVRVRHGDPLIAAEMANRLVELYLERRVQVFVQRDSEYFRERLDAARLEADKVDASVRELLGGQEPLVFETERDIRVARQATLETQIAEVEASIAGLSTRRAALERDVAALAPTVVDQRSLERNPVVLAAETRIVTLEAERNAAAASLGAAHPSVAALAREIEGLREIIASTPAEIETGGRIAVNPARSRAETNLADTIVSLRELEARRAHLVAERNENAAALVRAAEIIPELSALQRVAEAQREQVAGFDTSLRDSLAEEAQGRSPLGSVRILERADAPITPVGAPKSVRLIIALLVGAVMGLAAGVLSYLARPTVLTARMMEQRLGAPALAEIAWRRKGRAALRPAR